MGYYAFLKMLRQFPRELHSVRFENQPPPRLSFYYTRAILGSMFMYTNKENVKNIFYNLANLFLMANLGLLIFTMVLAISESDNTIEICDDLFFIIGSSFFLSKMYYMRVNASEFDQVIEDFEYYKKHFDPKDNNRPEVKEEMDEIYYWQRLFYVAEGIGTFFFSAMLSAVNLAICVQPLLSDKELPFHSAFPFEWHHKDAHPIGYVVIYAWMVITCGYNMICITHIELMGLHSMLETGLNLKIVGIEIAILGKLKNISDDEYQTRFSKIIRFHQHIIGTVENISRVSYITFITQLVTSYVLISMSTFVTMVTIDNPKVASKFISLVVLTLVQLSYWCLAGTYVEIESVNVAHAAFNMKDWHTKPIWIQRQIILLIIRAQKPLVYVASPFPPFSLETYQFILKQCYTVLTLLREAV